MDRKMELEHLAIAEQAIAVGQRHIEREERMIADLERDGHNEDIKLARETLAALRGMQAEHIAHRNLLLKMLQRQGGTSGPIYRPGQYECPPENHHNEGLLPKSGVC